MTKKTFQKKVISYETVHGYRGNPSTVYRLSCGHDQWVRSQYVFKHPKTKSCSQCYTEEWKKNQLGTQ